MDYKAIEMAQTTLLTKMDSIIASRFTHLVEYFQSDIPFDFPEYNEVMLLMLNQTIKDMHNFNFSNTHYAPILSNFDQIIERIDEHDRSLAQQLKIIIRRL